MEMHTFGVIKNVMTLCDEQTYFSFKKTTIAIYLWRNNIFAIVFLFMNNDLNLFEFH